MRRLALVLMFACWLIVWAGLLELRLVGGGLLAFLLVPLLSFLATLVHELGHFVAARAIGARVTALAALPIELRFHPLRLGLALRRPHPDIGGYVLYAPPAGMTRRQAILVAAAGPAANMGLAVVAVLLAALAPLLFAGTVAPRAHAGFLPPDAEVLRSLGSPFALREAEIAARIAAALAILSASLCVVNLIPFDRSDGALILSLWRTRRAA